MIFWSYSWTIVLRYLKINKGEIRTKSICLETFEQMLVSEKIATVNQRQTASIYDTKINGSFWKLTCFTYKASILSDRFCCCRPCYYIRHVSRSSSYTRSLFICFAGHGWNGPNSSINHLLNTVYFRQYHIVKWTYIHKGR